MSMCNVLMHANFPFVSDMKLENPFSTSALPIQHFSCQIKLNGMITYIIGCDIDKAMPSKYTYQPQQNSEQNVKFIRLLCIRCNGNRHNSLRFDILQRNNSTTHSMHTHTHSPSPRACVLFTFSAWLDYAHVLCAARL